MPTDYGFTGQRAESATGLDYYGARYYDPTLGQFTSADIMLAGGLNRYGYVGGNPISHTDPSGHMIAPPEDPQFGTGKVTYQQAGEGGLGGGGGAAPPGAIMVVAIGVVVLNPVAGLAVGGYLLVNYIQAQQASTALPHTSGPDELTRALRRESDTNDGTPIFHAHNPAKSAVRTAIHKTQPAGGSGSGAAGGERGAPQTQTGGGAGGSFGGGGNTTPAASPEDDGCGCGGQQSKRLPLYRAIGVNELNDVLKYGDYGIDPSGQGKDFAFTEEGARNFANTGLNVGRSMTITRITVPEEFVLSRGQPFFDSGGAGASVQFGYIDDVMFDLYDVMSPIEILDASWVRSVGC